MANMALGCAPAPAAPWATRTGPQPFSRRSGLIPAALITGLFFLTASRAGSIELPLPLAQPPSPLPAWWNENPNFEPKSPNFAEAWNEISQQLATLLGNQELKCHWAGPFTNVAGVGLTTAFPPEQEYLKQGFNPEGEYDGLKGKVRWIPPQKGFLPNNEPEVTYYCYSTLDWPEDEAITLKLFIDDNVALWLNREKVFTQEGYSIKSIRINLKKGRNEFFGKVTNNGGPWGLTLVPLRYSLERCQLKARAQLLAKVPGTADEVRQPLKDLLDFSAQLGERELFRHWALEGARVLSGKKKQRNEFLRDMCALLERQGYADLATAMVEAIPTQDLEEDTWKYWARAYQLGGNFDKALAGYKRIVESEAYSARGRFTAAKEMAELLASLGDYQGAVQAWDQFAAKFPEKNNDREFKKVRLDVEGRRESGAVLELDEDYERSSEQVGRLIQSGKDREAYHLIQKSLSGAGLRAVRTTADPQLFTGADEIYRRAFQKYADEYTKFLEPQQRQRWNIWRTDRQEAALRASLQETLDPARLGLQWLDAARWELERGRCEGAQARLSKAQSLLPESERASREEALKLGAFAQREIAQEQTLEWPTGNKDWRQWEFPQEAGFYANQLRQRLPWFITPELYAWPAERGGIFYLANENSVCAVAEGKELWRWASGGLTCREVNDPNVIPLPAKQQPAVDDRRVFVRALLRSASSPDGNFGLVCLDRLSGKELWRTNQQELAQSHVNSPPVLDGGLVLVTALTRTALTGNDRAELTLYAFDPESGQLVHKVFLGSNRETLDSINCALSIAAPSHDAENLYWDTGLGLMVAVERGTLNLKWEREYPRLHPGREGIFHARMLARMNGAPVLDGAGRVIFAPADSAFVYLLEAQTGKVLGRTVPPAFRELLGVGEGRIYFAGDTLLALSAQDLKLLWQTSSALNVRAVWLGRKEALVAFKESATQRVNLESGELSGADELNSNSAPLWARSNLSVSVKERKLLVRDARPHEWADWFSPPKPVETTPVRVIGAQLHLKEMAKLPYPGTRLTEKIDGTRWMFSSNINFGVYDSVRHQVLWKQPKTSGSVAYSAPYIIAIDGGQTKLTLYDEANGQRVWEWRNEKYAGAPLLQNPVIHGSQIFFEVMNNDWQSGLEHTLYLYDFKEKKLVDKVSNREYPRIRLALWNGEFETLAWPERWEKGAHESLVVSRPFNRDFKPVTCDLKHSRNLVVGHDRETGEYLLLGLEQRYLAVGRSPFDKMRVCTLPKRETQWEAEYTYREPLAFNAKYIVYAHYQNPRLVLDRESMTETTLPEEADIQSIQPMPYGKRGLLFAGKLQKGELTGEKEKLTNQNLCRLPYRTVYYLEDGQLSALGNISAYWPEPTIPEYRLHEVMSRMNGLCFRVNEEQAYVFHGAENYNEGSYQALTMPLRIFRVVPREKKLEGPWVLPLGPLARVLPLGREIACETAAGVYFYELAAGTLAPERKLLPLTFGENEDFVLDGFLRDWPTDGFTKLEDGVEVAAHWDGKWLRLAGTVDVQGVAAPENPALSIRFLSSGFYNGWAHPAMTQRLLYYAHEREADGCGFRCTPGLDGRVRFEAQLPLAALFMNQPREQGGMELNNPRTFLMRLDLLDPGTPGGTLFTLGGSAELRPFEMLALRPQKLDFAEGVKRRIEQGNLESNQGGVYWSPESGLALIVNPVQGTNTVTWSVVKKLPRRCALDFGNLISINRSEFWIKVYAQDQLIAEKSVKAGGTPEPFKVSLNEFGGKDTSIKVEFISTGREGPGIALQQLQIIRTTD